MLLRDLGYVTSYYLQSVIDKGAYFLNRLPSQMSVYDRENNKEKMDFKSLHKKMKKEGIPSMSFSVMVGRDAQIPCQMRFISTMKLHLILGLREHRKTPEALAVRFQRIKRQNLTWIFISPMLAKK